MDADGRRGGRGALGRHRPARDAGLGRRRRRAHRSHPGRLEGRQGEASGDSGKKASTSTPKAAAKKATSTTAEKKATTKAADQKAAAKKPAAAGKPDTGAAPSKKTAAAKGSGTKAAKSDGKKAGSTSTTSSGSGSAAQKKGGSKAAESPAKQKSTPTTSGARAPPANDPAATEKVVTKQIAAQQGEDKLAAAKKKLDAGKITKKAYTKEAAAQRKREKAVTTAEKNVTDTRADLVDSVVSGQAALDKQADKLAAEKKKVAAGTMKKATYNKHVAAYEKRRDSVYDKTARLLHPITQGAYKGRNSGRACIGKCTSVGGAQEALAATLSGQGDLADRLGAARSGAPRTVTPPEHLRDTLGTTAVERSDVPVHATVRDAVAAAVPRRAGARPGAGPAARRGVRREALDGHLDTMLDGPGLRIRAPVRVPGRRVGADRVRWVEVRVGARFTGDPQRLPAAPDARVIVLDYDYGLRERSANTNRTRGGTVTGEGASLATDHELGSSGSANSTATHIEGSSVEGADRVRHGIELTVEVSVAAASPGAAARRRRSRSAARWSGWCPAAW